MTVMTNVVLVLKDSEGNIGIVKPLTDNDIIKIANAITDVGQVVDPATHMPIEATTASVGVVQLATAQDIKDGTANKVVDAKELINFAQTLPAVNGITDVSSGDNSNQLVVSKFGGSKTLTINNVEHAGNADEATHATQADTAASANSVAWDKVSGKPSSYTPSSHTHDDRYYTESEVNTLLAGKANSDHDHSRYGMYFTDVCADTNTGWYESRYKGEGDDGQTHLYINDYFGIHFHTAGYFDVNGKAIIHEGNIGSQSVNYANSAGSVAWSNVSGRPTALSQFTNDSGYITTDGAAYPRRVGGVTMNFNWSGQGGQPTWLWGGEDGTNMYVYNPANFSVNYANSAGNADTLDGVHEYSFLRRRENTSANGEGTLWSQIGIKEYYGALPDGLSGIYNWGEVVSLAGSSCRFDIYCSHQSSNGNGLYYRSGWGDDKQPWRRFIDSENIGSQSVNYANSAGSVAWGNVSGRPDIWIG